MPRRPCVSGDSRAASAAKLDVLDTSYAQSKVELFEDQRRSR